jgi:hypothetical protein
VPGEESDIRTSVADDTQLGLTQYRQNLLKACPVRNVDRLPQAVSRLAQRLRGRTPNAQVELVDDANFLIFIDQPEVVAELVEEFLRIAPER